MLISSVFEAAPPKIARPITPTKASKSARDDELDHAVSSDSTQSGPTSPLAEIFGRSANRHSKVSKPAKSTQVFSKEELNEVESMKEEVKAVRESQLRMEEMLTKVLSASK